MDFKTKITKIKNGEEFIRGESLISMIGTKSFSETIYFLFKGDWPSEEYKKMMDVILVSCIDHGPGTVSALNARIAASAKVEMSAAIASGLLTIGQRHGGATGDSAEFFQKNIECEDILSLLKDLKEKKIRVPGFGHAVLEKDLRAEKLFDLAKELGVYGKHCEFALDVYDKLNSISSKHLPINVDAAIGAILSDMGFDYELAKGFFMISRMPGLVAQFHEESMNDVGLRRLSEDNIEYTGD